jgi:hypothetical protein
MTRGLVQTGGLARRSDSAPRKALRRSSDTAPRCLESASTTDVSRHEHPRQTSPLETARRAAVGNPPAFRPRDRPRRDGVSAISSEDGAGPPCGHPASNDSVLDGTSPASGRSTARLRACALGAGDESAAALSAARRLRRFEPSDTSCSGRSRGRVSAHVFRSPEPPSGRARQCADLPEARGAFRRRRPRRRLSRAPMGALPPLAGGAGAARFHRCSKNLD